MTLEDFWAKIHAGDVTILRDNLHAIKQDTMFLTSGKTVQSDFFVMCTGWGDHFAIFDDATKLELGLPLYGKNNEKNHIPDPAWEKLDREASLSVDRKLPFLAKGPVLKHPQSEDRRWRLYRRVVPLALAEKGDRSIAILGQIHTVQTPLVAEVQSFWAILYLLGEIELPGQTTMAKEVAEWNAWTRKRYQSQGQKFPYSLYDFLPVSELQIFLAICFLFLKLSPFGRFYPLALLPYPTGKRGELAGLD